MSTYDFGASDWSANAGSGKDGQRKDLWLKLGHGDNKLRLITKPYKYWSQDLKFKDNEGKQRSIKIPSSISVDGRDVIKEQTGDDPKPRWLVGVIDRKTGTYKLLDIGPGVYKSIKKYNDQEEWGAPDKYDINIVVNKNAASPADYYSVLPLPHKPLSPNDLQVKEQVDIEYLLKRTKPPTYDEMKANIESLKKRFNAVEPVVEKSTVNNVKPTTAVTTHTTTVATSSSDDSFNDMFPTADGSDE